VYKLVHRTLSLIIVFSMFVSIIYLINEFNFPLFVGFLLGIPIIYIPLVMFLKVPFICDQKGCYGSAQLVINENLQGKWYRHFLLTGHKCNQCNHVIKLPKTSSSSNHNLD
jgi:hypothetical protein